MCDLNVPILSAKVQFVLHREFVDEGQYTVNVGGLSSLITVKRIQNVESMNTAHMDDLEFFGTVASTHDYHGVFNISEITIYLKYLNMDVIKDVRKTCISYLNKLVQVVRLHTRRYWLEPVTEPDIQYIRMVE